MHLTLSMSVPDILTKLVLDCKNSGSIHGVATNTTLRGILILQ